MNHHNQLIDLSFYLQIPCVTKDITPSHINLKCISAFRVVRVTTLRKDELNRLCKGETKHVSETCSPPQSTIKCAGQGHPCCIIIYAAPLIQQF